MKEQIEEIIKKYETRLPQHKCYCILERDYDKFIEELVLLKNKNENTKEVETKTKS